MGKLSLAISAIAIPAAFLVAGCAEVGVGFPAVHDMPAPRADTPMTPDQVKQATEDLVTERDRLNTSSLPPPAAPNNAAAAKKRVLAAKARAKPPAPKPSTAAQNAAPAPAPAAPPEAAVTAGAYAKP
jgi:hypothetical protein